MNVRWGIVTSKNSKNDGAGYGSEWLPLWKRDSFKIEKLYKEGDYLLNSNCSNPANNVSIRNTHCMANIKDRIVTNNYNNEAFKQKLVRGTWFWKYDGSGSSGNNEERLVAFPESIAVKIETWYQSIKEEIMLDCMKHESEPHRPHDTHGRNRAKKEKEVTKSWALPLGEVMGSNMGQYKLIATKNLANTGKIQRLSVSKSLTNKSLSIEIPEKLGSGPDEEKVSVSSMSPNLTTPLDKAHLEEELLYMPRDADSDADMTDVDIASVKVNKATLGAFDSVVDKVQQDTASSTANSNWLQNIFGGKTIESVDNAQTDMPVERVPESGLDPLDIDEDDHNLFCVVIKLVKCIDFIGSIHLTSYEVFRGYHNVAHVNASNTSSMSCQMMASGSNKPSVPSAIPLFRGKSRDELQEEYEWGGGHSLDLETVSYGITGNIDPSLTSAIPDTANNTSKRPASNSAPLMEDVPTGHLLFAIHGIGEALFSANGDTNPPSEIAAKNILKSFRDTVNAFSTLCQECISDNYDSGARVPMPLPLSKPVQSLNSESEPSMVQGEPTDVVVNGDLTRYRVDCIPIEWHDCIHDADSKLKQTIQSVTNANVNMMREFGNAAAVDLLTYQTPKYQERVLEAVSKRINRIYTRYCELNPKFTGNCSIIGHSLGSVIAFDTLVAQQMEENALTDRGVTLGDNEKVGANRTPDAAPDHPFLAKEARLITQQLHFKPLNLFLLGSPLALFYSIRNNGNELSTNYSLPTGTAVFNIFHPFDPVAYRLEPLLSKHFQNVEPCILDHHTGNYLHYQFKQFTNDINSGIDRLKQITSLTSYNIWFQTMVGGTTDAEGLSSTQLDKQTNSSRNVQIESGLNTEGRLDFKIQESILENANSYLAAVASHSCYFDNKDVAMFIASKLTFEAKK